MNDSTWTRAALVTIGAAALMTACTAGSPARKDLSISGDDLGVEDLRAPADLRSTDLAGADLSTSTADLTGSPWTLLPSSTSSALFAVWGSSTGTVWAAGEDGTVVKSVSGGAFAAETGLPGGISSVTWFGLSGTSATSVYAVGDSGTIMRLTNTSWAMEAISPTTSSELSGVWAGSGAAFASGVNSTLLTTTGTPPWTPVNGATHNVNGIWGSSASDVYAVGQGNLVSSTGVILHYNGAGDFTAQAVPGTASSLFAVGGSGAGDVYAVGANGVILHSTGNGTWTQQTSGTTESLNAVAGVAGKVYAVGDAATVLVSNDSGTTWTADNQGSGSWRGVWVSATDVYIVGDNGNIYHR